MTGQSQSQSSLLLGLYDPIVLEDHLVGKGLDYAARLEELCIVRIEVTVPKGYVLTVVVYILRDGCSRTDRADRR